MALEPLTLTVEEAGELLGISRALAYDLVRQGQRHASLFDEHRQEDGQIAVGGDEVFQRLA